MARPSGRKQQPARRWGASYTTQLHILFIRAVKTRRFESLSSQDFAQFVIVGILSGEVPPFFNFCASAVTFENCMHRDLLHICQSPHNRRSWGGVDA